MKLYFMKQNAIDFLKANMKNYYVNYFRYNTNDWILDLFDYDPFEFFIDVPDFKLAPIRQPIGGTVFENCKVIYTNLRNISDSQASDERLWAGLCNGVFYQYVRGRWNYPSLTPQKPDSDTTTIISRFFFSGAGISGKYRNTLAKCWWVGRETYLADDTFHWKMLDMIGAEDIATKVSEIFYSNTFSSNPDILLGLCRGLEFFRKHGKKVVVKDHLRPTLKYMNALGGGLLLDALSVEDIEAIVKESIGNLMNGEQGGLDFDEDTDVFAQDDVDDNAQGEAETINVDYYEEQEAIEQEVEYSDDSVILGDPETVGPGNTVTVLRKPSFMVKTYIIPFDETNRRLYQVEREMLGKKVGESVNVGRETFVIKQIKWT